MLVLVLLCSRLKTLNKYFDRKYIGLIAFIFTSVHILVYFYELDFDIKYLKTAYKFGFQKTLCFLQERRRAEQHACVFVRRMESGFQNTLFFNKKTNLLNGFVFQKAIFSQTTHLPKTRSCYWCDFSNYDIDLE